MREALHVHLLIKFKVAIVVAENRAGTVELVGDRSEGGAVACVTCTLTVKYICILYILYLMQLAKGPNHI